MKKQVYTLIIVLITGITLFGQEHFIGIENMQNISSIKSSNLKSSFYIESRPDSVVSYLDSLGVNSFYSSHYVYDVSKIIYSVKKINEDSTERVNYNKIEYFMDSTLPKLKYESLMSISILTINDGPPYMFIPSIGDTLSLYYVWDTLNSEWQKSYKTIHSINSEGINQHTETYELNDTTNLWGLNTYTNRTVYNESPDSLLVECYLKDSTIGKYQKYEFCYNSNNQITKFSIGVSPYITVDSFIYNDAGQLMERLTISSPAGWTGRTEYFYDSKNRIEKTKYFSGKEDAGEMQFYYAAYYYYPDFSSSTSNSIVKYDAEVIVYPNPASESLVCQNYEGELSIINSMGQQVFHSFIELGEQLNISSLDAGVYFVQFETGTFTRFIKK